MRDRGADRQTSPASSAFLVSDAAISFSLFKAVFRGTLKSNPALQSAWEAARNDPENEHDNDCCVLDILGKMGIDTALCSGCYENEYEVGDCCISHEEVIELIENVRSEDTGSCRFGSPEDESEDEEASEQFHKIPVLRQELHRIHMPRRH